MLTVLGIPSYSTGYFGNSSNFLLCVSLKGTQQQQVVWLLFLEASHSSRALPGECQTAFPSAAEELLLLQLERTRMPFREASTVGSTGREALSLLKAGFCAAPGHLSIAASGHRFINVFCTHPSPICTEQPFLFQDQKHTVALKPIICLLQGCVSISVYHSPVCAKRDNERGSNCAKAQYQFKKTFRLTPDNQKCSYLWVNMKIIIIMKNNFFHDYSRTIKGH